MTMSRRIWMAVFVLVALIPLSVIDVSAGTSDPGADLLPVGFSVGPKFPETFAPRWNFASAYFPPADQVVLFGGAPADLQTTWWNDTWLYAGGAWSQGPEAPAGLTPRGGAAMAYDPSIGRIVMFGGEARAADGSEVWPPYTNETWLWNGATWTPGPAAPSDLAARTGAQMVYDDALDRIVLFGGSGLDRYTDTWLFDGSQWTRGPDAPAGMRPRVFFGMAYDQAAEKVVVGGGDGSSDVWLFNGSDWAPGPSFPDTMVNNRRERTRMAYDPQLEAVVLFGGLGPGKAEEEVYYLRTSVPGSTWVQIPERRPPGNSSLIPPAPRMDGAVVWVPTLDAMMFFGGFVSGFEGRMGYDDTTFFREAAPVIRWASIGPDPPPPGVGLTIDVGRGDGGYGEVYVSLQWLINGVPLPNFKKRTLPPIWVVGDVIQAKVQASDILGLQGAEVLSNTVTIHQDGAQAFRRAELFAPAPYHGGAATPQNGGGPASLHPPTARPGSPSGPEACSSPTPGQVVACDNQFWKDGVPILLHGVNVSGIAQQDDMTRLDYERIASLHMNVVRMRIGWGQFEKLPPTLEGNVWVHHYRTGIISELMDQIKWAQHEGIGVIIESRCFCGNGWPEWLSRAPYNSHGKNYDFYHPDGRAEFNTDFWSDPLLQKFAIDWGEWLASIVQPADGIIGYEPIVEPSAGRLPANHDTTQMILDWQLQLAEAVRAQDPNRIIFFTTRGSTGVGVLKADFSAWQAFGNVAFDTHDFFGARWGSSFDQTGDPDGTVYGEGAQILFNFTLNTKDPPYLGTTEGQARFVEAFTDTLAPAGIPVYIGEFAGNTAGDPPDPDILAVFGTMSQAMNLEGVAWTALSYDGYHSLYDPDGNPNPWTPILCNAAAYPQIVTDCPTYP
jgi:Cellulase (glycosyl hydrolase family 5)/Galactose oxidase, central domain